EPRRGRVRRPERVRHPAPSESAPLVRDRRALLPGRASCPPRGQGLLRRAAHDVPAHRADRRAGADSLEPQQRAEGPADPPYASSLVNASTASSAVELRATVTRGIKNESAAPSATTPAANSNAGRALDAIADSMMCRRVETSPADAFAGAAKFTPRACRLV